MIDLILGPGPRLTWRCYPRPEPIDVSSSGSEFLLEPVELRGTVTLGDVLKLFLLDPALQKAFRRYWAPDVCAEVEKGALPRTAEPDEGSRLEYLELYRSWGFDSFEKTFSGVYDVQMHGVSAELTVDSEEHFRKAGQRVEWGLSLADVRTLLDLPLRIRQDIPVHETDVDSVAYGAHLYTTHSDTLLLGQLLGGLLSELTFHGGPANQDSFRAELAKRMEDVESGRSKTIPLEQVAERLAPTPVWPTLYQSLGTAEYAAVRKEVKVIPDAEPAEPWLKRIFGEELSLKPEFAAATGRELRRATRMARTAAFIEGRNQRKAGG